MTRKKRDLIIKLVRVNRTRTPEDAIAATGCRQRVDHEVIATMPQGKDGEVEVVFFTLNHWVGDGELATEYDARDLVPVDPITLAAVNEEDPNFLIYHPNATHWPCPDGGYNALYFEMIVGITTPARHVIHIDRPRADWARGWWFGGVRRCP